ncbi:MAG TPA: glycoside hydrolase family 13 protein [Anaerolineales bacterium]|nr:glycoside hydrolase family 13 protein [Anaerolineales bacterium]HNA89075.1 glycoside hydrolase family 13 protein [Anaerolineales bacterium]HNB35427.1 glycoside hydrolase family 13 protein [Anaerolineales bacterium]HNC07518.1 glycoside hydrolase family 13 protein [Anaerolineales bacterium]
MSTPSWVKDAVFYQIFPDRFARSKKNDSMFNFESWDSPPTTYGFKGGDLYGVIEKLDYLQDLGINAIYFNPVFASASNHRYHTFDYYNVDPLLGGNDALKKLLNAAHKRDIRIVLDGVFNHASRGFWQFHHVLETGEASPYKDWFHFDEERLKGHKHWGVYPSQHEQRLLHQEDSLTAIGYRAWWNLPALPKFNTNTPAVREFLFDVAEYWIKFGIDGWRLDVPGEIDDDEFWREFRRRVRAINPEAYIVGEIWHEAQRWLQGDQFDAVMNYLFTAAALNFFAGSHLNMDVIQHAGGLKDRVHHTNANGFANEVDRILNLYPQDINFAQLNLLDSHDMPRFLSCASGDKNSLKLAWLFLMTMPGAPCIYYGDEVGVDGGHDPDCRKSFPWDESKWDHDLLAYAKECISLRNKHKVLRRGDYKRVHTEDNVMVYAREQKNETLTVLFNASTTTRIITLKFENPPKVIFGSLTIEGDQVVIPARSGAVVKTG